MKRLSMTSGCRCRRLVSVAAFLSLLFGFGHTSCRHAQAVIGVQESKSAADEFTIAVIGDTQNYVDFGDDRKDSDCQGMAPFTTMIQWIVANQTKENIKYVTSLGDITDQYGATDTATEGQWARAYQTYELLKKEGIPFGLVPGNHDINAASRGNYPKNGTTFPVNKLFTRYFNRTRFPEYNREGYPQETSNENHYDVVATPAGEFLFLYLRWHHMENEADSAVNWAHEVMSRPENAARKVVVATHFVVAPEDEDLADGKKDWGRQRYQLPGYSQAEKIYNRLKQFPNFFLFLGGHATGEYERQDTYNGSTVKSFTSDFSNSCGTGSRGYPEGVLRTMRFSMSRDLIEIRSFVPGQVPVTLFTRPWKHGFTTSRTSDFDNDGDSQPAFFSAGAWTIAHMSGVFFGGISGAIPVPADYDGDGKTDIAIYSPDGQWKISGDSGVITLGRAGDIPVPGDFDGNGTVDKAVYRPSSSTFYVHQDYLPSVLSSACGRAGDIPVPADYDGDGKVDFATFHPSTATWTIFGISHSRYGEAGDIPVPGDYLGEGRNTRSVYRPATGTWYVEGRAGVEIGRRGDIPVPGDYNGDGKTDMAVYRPATGDVIIAGQATRATGVTNGQPLNLPFHISKFFFQ